MKTLRSTICLLAAGAAASAVSPSALGAQSIDDFAAYSALVLTTSGNLSPLVLPDLLAGAGGTHLALRAGFISPWGSDDDQFTSVVATVQLPLGRDAAIGLTAGALNSDCDGCDPQLMLGLSTTLVPFRVPLGPGSAVFSTGLEAEGGWTELDTGIGNLTALSGSLGVPLAVSGEGSGMRLAFSVSPAFGYGRMSYDGLSDSGTRPIVGAGAALSTGMVTFNLGMRKVFIDNGRALFGGGVAFRFGGGR